MPAPTYTPTSNDGLLLSYLRNQIANSATFQAVVEADNATEARGSIHFGLAMDGEVDATFPVQAEDPWPRCILRLIDDELANRIGTRVWELRPQILCVFEFNTPADYLALPQDAYLWMVDKTSAIRAEMLALTGNPYVDLVSLRRGSLGFLPREDHNGRHGLVGELFASINCKG